VQAPAADRLLFERYKRQNVSIDGVFTKLARELRGDGDLTEIKRYGDLLSELRDQRTQTATSLGLVECGS
jgi:hypothetical protein